MRPNSFYFVQIVDLASFELAFWQSFLAFFSTNQNLEFIFISLKLNLKQNYFTSSSFSLNILSLSCKLESVDIDSLNPLKIDIN